MDIIARVTNSLNILIHRIERWGYEYETDKACTIAYIKGYLEAVVEQMNQEGRK